MCALCQQLGIDFHKLSAGVTDGTADGASVSWAALPGGSGADLEGPGSDTVVGSTGTSSTISGGTSVRGYINACPHVGLPLNLSGDYFFDTDGKLLLCQMHGALFRPEDGFCVSGPCEGEHLQPLKLELREGAVWLCP